MTAVFDGMVAIITGGGSGIGQAAGSSLADLGATCALLDVSYTDVEVIDDGVGVMHVPCDVSNTEQVDAAIDSVAEQYGRVDVVINNAGIGAIGSIDKRDDDEWNRLYDVNVLGIVRVTRAATPYLQKSDHPAVVNVGSIAGWAGLPERAAYSATKGAVHALTLAMAADALPLGIRVNAVAPGTADTPWVQRLLNKAEDPEAERKALAARQPSGRLVTPDEVAAAICYLAGRTAGSVTGTILAVDGGMAGLRTRPRS